MNSSPIIVALDNINLNIINSIISDTYDHISGYKIGLEFYSFFGNNGIKWIKEIIGNKILILDLKLQDIPNTIDKTIRSLVRFEPDFLTICAFGQKMIRAAIRAAGEGSIKHGVRCPKILVDTTFTSIDADDLIKIFLPKNLNASDDYLSMVVENLTRSAEESNVDGIICSPQDIKNIRIKFNKLILFTSGIRSQNILFDDQNRIGTPEKALIDGANYLIIGRSITETANPKETILKILKEIKYI